jgi:hypothetical protein
VTDSQTRYLHEQLTTAQSKYAYFLLAAAASAIALAVNRTAGTALAVSQIPLGAAVACWALSFYFGCRHVSYVAATLRANVALSMIQSGVHPEVPAHPQYIQAAAEGTREAGEGNAEGAGRNARRQFQMLVAGAVFYLAWHVLGMTLRTPEIATRLPGWLR